MKERTDPHCPSRIRPEEYEYVAMELVRVADLGDALFLKDEREAIRRHMARTGGTYSRHEHGGNCMICGSVNAIYTVLFYHTPTNSYVRAGTDCAEKLGIGDPETFRSFRTKAEGWRAAMAGKARAKGTLEAGGLGAAWAVYLAEAAPEGGWPYEEATIRDIVGRLVTYGTISPKQTAFIGALLRRIGTRTERLALRAAEREAAAPCPSGRVTITGRVLTTKVVASDWTPGGVRKMLVKTPAGWTAYGTAPSKLGGDLRGATVRFTATLIPCDRDPKHGFFSRPSAASILAAAPPAADPVASEEPEPEPGPAEPALVF